VVGDRSLVVGKKRQVKMVKSYKELETWQLAMKLVAEVYRVTKDFPKEEIYGLTNQVRRAAVSVPSNIAEGQGRNSTKEFLHYLSIARGSLFEVETQLEIARQLFYIRSEDAAFIEQLIASVGRLINGLSRSLTK
jgi:four helix bundle protein